MPWIRKSASEIEAVEAKERKSNLSIYTFVFILWSSMFAWMTFRNGYDHALLALYIVMILIFIGVMFIGRWFGKKFLNERVNDSAVGAFSAYTGQARRLSLGSNWSGDVDILKINKNMICIECDAVLPITKEMTCSRCGAICEDPTFWKWVEPNEVQPDGAGQPHLRASNSTTT